MCLNAMRDKPNFVFNTQLEMKMLRVTVKTITLSLPV